MATKTQSRPRLADLYFNEVQKKLKEEFKLENVHQVPRLEKIVVNVGTGRLKEDNRGKEVVVNTLRKITGQQPVESKAKKSIAAFKLRDGQTIGYKVTLRGDRMYEFLDRLVTVVLPRLRDFHGTSKKAFDRAGNYSIGFNDQSIFPELTFEDLAVTHGMQINMVTTGKDAEQSKSLLLHLGVPIEKEKA